MSTGVLPCTLTFTYENPTNPPLFNPVSYDVDLPYVEYFGPLRPAEVPSGTELTGYGYCKRKGVSEVVYASENLGSVKCTLHATLGLRMYLDVATAPLFILKNAFLDITGFQTALVDCSRVVNGEDAEIDPH
jgi:hypothetical protein